MEAIGKTLKFYRELITECIPLFVAAGVIAALGSTALGTELSYLEKLSEGVYSLVLPAMAGYKAGKKCGGDAGGLAGALAASAVLMTANGAAFMVSILAGCCSGCIYREGMKRLEKVIPAGFEMLAGNLYLAASGLFSGLAAYYVLLPSVMRTESLLSGGIAAMAGQGLLPWSGVLVEPLKILFLNNWLNHGLLLPLGLEQVREAGGSLLFLLEANPGPGFGLLAALALSRRAEKREMTSSLVIQMFGGIHEIYFPYVLTDLRLLAAVMAGGVAGNYCFMLMGCQLRGPASPGSIITILLVSAPKHWIALIAGILASAAVSFSLAWLILLRPSGKKEDSVEKEPARWTTGGGGMRNMKIYFVCDAGMGSSAMASSLFKKKLKAEGLEGIEVFHVPVDSIPEDADVLVCQQSFASRLPHTGLPCFTVENLVDMAGYEVLLKCLKGDK